MNNGKSHSRLFSDTPGAPPIGLDESEPLPPPPVPSVNPNTTPTVGSNIQNNNKTPKPHEGWLYKSDNKGRGYKKRYFVLSDSQFRYRKKKSRTDDFIKEPEHLKFAKLNPPQEPFPSQAKTNFKFRVKIPGRMYFLCAETQEELQVWLLKFEEHIAYAQIPTASRAAPLPPPIVSGGVEIYQEAEAEPETDEHSEDDDEDDDDEEEEEEDTNLPPPPPTTHPDLHEENGFTGEDDEEEEEKEEEEDIIEEEEEEEIEAEDIEDNEVYEKYRRDLKEKQNSSMTPPPRPPPANDNETQLVLSNPTSSEQESNIFFHIVLTQDDSDGTRTFEMGVLESHVDDMTVGEIKHNFAEQMGVDPEQIQLSIGGHPAMDEFTGADFGLSDYTIFEAHLKLKSGSENKSTTRVATAPLESEPLEIDIMLGNTRCPVPLSYNPETDDAMEIAIAFCKEHGLDVDSVASAVAAQIKELELSTQIVASHEKTLTAEIEELYTQLAIGGPVDHVNLVKTQKARHTQAENTLRDQLKESQTQLIEARKIIQQRETSLQTLQSRVAQMNNTTAPIPATKESASSKLKQRQSKNISVPPSRPAPRNRRKSIKKDFGQKLSGKKAPVATSALEKPKSGDSDAEFTELVELRHKVAILERHAVEHRRKNMIKKQSSGDILTQLQEETAKAALVPTLELQLKKATEKAAKAATAAAEVVTLSTKVTTLQNQLEIATEKEIEKSAKVATLDAKVVTLTAEVDTLQRHLATEHAEATADHAYQLKKIESEHKKLQEDKKHAMAALELSLAEKAKVHEEAAVLGAVKASTKKTFKGLLAKHALNLKRIVDLEKEEKILNLARNKFEKATLWQNIQNKKRNKIEAEKVAKVVLLQSQLEAAYSKIQELSNKIAQNIPLPSPLASPQASPLAPPLPLPLPPKMNHKQQEQIKMLQKQLSSTENQLRLSRMISGDNTRETPPVRASSAARATRDDWRRFAEEKREMTRRYNLDRAALAAENHRMRVALSGKPPNSTNINKEKDLMRLQSELSSERMLKKAAEQQITELATQLHNIQRGGNLTASSANSFGQSTLAQKLFQTEKELEKLRIERDESNNNTNWRVERGELLSNWNVS